MKYAPTFAFKCLPNSQPTDTLDRRQEVSVVQSATKRSDRNPDAAPRTLGHPIRRRERRRRVKKEAGVVDPADPVTAGTPISMSR